MVVPAGQLSGAPPPGHACGVPAAHQGGGCEAPEEGRGEECEARQWYPGEAVPLVQGAEGISELREVRQQRNRRDGHALDLTQHDSRQDSAVEVPGLAGLST